MILKDKKILITGILTDKSIAYATAQVAIRKWCPSCCNRLWERSYASPNEQ